MHQTRSELALEAGLKVLEAGLRDLQASSGTFYVRDPWWPNQLRLAYMPGVKIKEPMHGFLLPAFTSERMTEPQQDSITIFNQAYDDPRLSDADQFSPTLARLVAQNKLFGNFVQREEVRASARLRHYEAGELQAVLWVNYCDVDKISRPKERRMVELMAQMVEYLPAIQATLRSKNPIPPQLAHILQLAETLKINDPAFEKEFATGILKAMLEILKIDNHNGYGSIYFFSPRQQTLVRKFHEGGVEPPAPTTVDISQGEGIVSWVALKRRALLIADLDSSPYKEFYREAVPDITSELTVPMVANDQLLGVINLESKVPFPDSMRERVRSIWYGANQAAMIFYLAQQVKNAEAESDHRKRLLQIAHMALAPTASNTPLNELAKLARDWFGSADCAIWPYLTEYDRFTESGSTFDPELGGPPRHNGWCQYIRRNKVWVWIYDVTKSTEFKCKYWDQQEKNWQDFPADNQHPSELSNNVIDKDMTGAFGIPIDVSGRCIGVAWLRYKDVNIHEPDLEQMSLAEGFAAQCGLVLDVLQHNKESAEIGTQLRHYHKTTSPTKPIEYPGLKGYVLSQPHGEIGGDFHSDAPIDDKRTAFLLGDAQGHGMLAAFQVLPMSTIFRMSSRESVSAKHLLWKLLPVCNDWELKGTAICFILDISDAKKPRIFASSAGHEPLLIFRRGREVPATFPDTEGVANIGRLGHGLNLPIGEEVKELAPDDLIIAYTDGITDAGEDSHGRGFGQNGIINTVLDHYDKDPQEIASEIEKSARAYAQGQLKDDATIMVLRVMK